MIIYGNEKNMWKECSMVDTENGIRMVRCGKIIDINKEIRHKEKIAKNRANKDLINSFYPRTYPGTLRSTYIF